MGIDTRVYISKESFKGMDLWDAIYAYQNFTGRWQSVITQPYFLDANENSISMKDLINHIALANNIHDKYRDKLKPLAKFEIVFQADCMEPLSNKLYIDICKFLYDAFNLAKGEIKNEM